MANLTNLPHLPIGTQVVTTVDVHKSNGEIAFMRGAVGVIVHVPTEPSAPYRVRFVDGMEELLHHEQLAVRSHFTAPQQEHDETENDDLNRYIIYRCIVGSRAYGLEHAGSDVDRRGIYLPPATRHWSIHGVPEQLENEAEQSCYWELQKFLVLVLKANPNILECLYTPLVEEATPLAQELLAMRSSFLSKLLYQTYNGYVMSQFRHLQRHHQTQGEIKWKHAMHLIRLLLAGITALKEGHVPVAVGEYRDRLLAIRRNQMRWEEVDGWRLQLHREFEQALQHTALPERPNYEAANGFLLKARRSMVQGE